jgi:uncharacterized protein YjiS (DUF1127 family)
MKRTKQQHIVELADLGLTREERAALKPRYEHVLGLACRTLAEWHMNMEGLSDLEAKAATGIVKAVLEAQPHCNVMVGEE